LPIIFAPAIANELFDTVARETNELARVPAVESTAATSINALQGAILKKRNRIIIRCKYTRCTLSMCVYKHREIVITYLL